MRAGVVAVALMMLCGCQAKTEPAQPESPGTIAQEDTDKRIAQWIEAREPGAGELMLRSGRYDLDGDGVNELLAYAAGPTRCGSGGCNLLVLKVEGDSFKELGNISVVQLPVGVLSSKTNGMRDLAVTVYGGGQPQATMRVPFDGTAYAPNATTEPATQTDELGAEVIADAPLRPAS